MRIPFKELRNYLVETVGGKVIGKVYDVIFELDGQIIAQYIVKSSLIHRETYLISRDQVVRFENEKIIVDNSVRSDVNNKKETATFSDSSPEPVAMRENN